MGAINLTPLQQTIKKAIVEWNNKQDPTPLRLMNEVNQLSYAIEKAIKEKLNDVEIEHLKLALSLGREPREPTKAELDLRRLST